MCGVCGIVTVKSRDVNDDDDDDVFVTSLEDSAAGSASATVTDTKRRSQSLSALTNEHASALSHAATADVSPLNCLQRLQLFMGSPSQSYEASPAIWEHAMLSVTRRR